MTGVTKKKKRNKKNKGEKAEKKVPQNEHRNYVHKNNGDKKSEESEPDSTELPEMKDFNDDNEKSSGQEREPAQMRTAKTVIILSRQRMIRQIHHRRQQFPILRMKVLHRRDVTAYKLDSQGTK